MTKIFELISILDVMTFRPNKSYFRGIGWEEDFQSYMREENKNRDVQLFYFEKLIKFLKKELENNKHEKIKKRFIIYLNTRGVISSKIANKFQEAQAKDAIMEKMEIIFGSNPLYLHLGGILKGNACFVRFYSRERWVLSQDLIKMFKNDFKKCKLIYGGWNTFSSNSLETDLVQF